VLSPRTCRSQPIAYTDRGVPDPPWIMDSDPLQRQLSFKHGRTTGTWYAVRTSTAFINLEDLQEGCLLFSKSYT